MESTNSKIQIYLDKKPGGEIKARAEKSSLSISKYVARVLENHVNNGSENELFQIKTQAILAQILSSVYDYDAVNANADEVKGLLQKIEEKAKQKIDDL